MNSDTGGVESERLTIAVTGATGFVGRAVVRALAERGHSVRTLVRDMDKARDALGDLDYTPVKGDIFNADAVGRLCDGCNGVIHLIGIRREGPARKGVTFRRMHVEATGRILEAAKQAGARRYIHMSALGARPLTRSRYHQTKYEAEQLVRSSGLGWTIFQPSIIHGPDGEFMQMAAGWVRGEEQPKYFLPYFFTVDPDTGETRAGRVQIVSVEDVAGVFVDALSVDEAIGEVYPIGGPEAMDWPSLLTTIRDHVPGANPKLKPRGISGDFASYMAQAAGIVGLGQLLPFGPDEPLMAMEDSTCSLARAEAHLGYRPREFVEELSGYARRI